MEKKKYYAITTSMTFEKTVLVPVDSVKDIDEAIDLVDCGVEVSSIDLLNEEADCETKRKRKLVTLSKLSRLNMTKMEKQ